MRYLKIYENYFLEKDKVKEMSKKLDEDLTQEILDLIPDISSIDSFEHEKQIYTNSNNQISQFKFQIYFDKCTPVEDYKNIIISDLYRLNNILSRDYDIFYSIEFQIYNKNNIVIYHISRDNLKGINFSSLKDAIQSTEENLIKLSNQFPKINLNDKMSFKKIDIYIKRI